MEIREGDFVVTAGPGFRQQAADYAQARLRERDKTQRTLIFAVTALAVFLGSVTVFAPEGRVGFAYITGAVVLVLALGAIRARRFLLKVPSVEINVPGDEKESQKQG